MSLLIQVDLVEARAAAPGMSILPQGGLLQVFYDVENFWESGPLPSISTVRLNLHEPGVALASQPGPGLPEDPMGIRFEVRPILAEDDLPEDDDAYNAWTNPMHQILGFPFPLQNDPMRWPTDNVPDPLRVLVLQLGSDDALGWCFGDLGNLYFLADGATFQNGRIEKAHFEFQCH